MEQSRLELRKVVAPYSTPENGLKRYWIQSICAFKTRKGLKETPALSHHVADKPRSDDLHVELAPPI